MQINLKSGRAQYEVPEEVYKELEKFKEFLNDSNMSQGEEATGENKDFHEGQSTAYAEALEVFGDILDGIKNPRGEASE